MVFSIPFLVSAGAFNQTSGDIQVRSLRYVLLRTERANIFIGRFLGTAAFVMAVLGLLCGVVLLYLVGKVRFYPPGDVVLWMAQGFLAILLLSLPYIAFCAWISAAIDSPIISLVISQVVVLFAPVIVYAMTVALAPARYLGYVLPWPLKYELLSPHPLHVAGAGAAMLGYTGLYLWLGLKTFEGRDL